MNPHHEGFFVIAAIENADATALGQTLHTAPEIIVIEVFAGRRLERINLAALRIEAGHDMLDGAVFSGGVHRLKYQQYCPTVLRIEHVLKLGHEIDTHGERVLGARLVLRRKLQRVAGIDVLETKLVVDYSERFGKPPRLLDQVFHFFVVQKSTSFLVTAVPVPNVRLSLQHRRDPAEQARMDFVAVDLIEHFVSSSGVEIVGDVVNARFTIAVYQDLESFESLAHGIFTARQQVDGQVGPYLAKTDRVRQPVLSR